MLHTIRRPTPRRIYKASLDSDLVAAALELEINVPETCERSLEVAIADARADRWMEAHREVVESYIEYVGNHLPSLNELRGF